MTAITEPGSWKSEFTYDGKMRRRIRKEYNWQSAIANWVLALEVRYVYDGKLVIQERHFHPQLSTQAPFNVISYARGRDISGGLEGAGGVGGLLARTDHSTFNSGDPASSPHAYYHGDGNGNVTFLLASNQTLVARYAFDPFGNIASAVGPLADVNLYRFSSKEAHLNSGSIYYLYRFYEPSLQRWMNRDPIAEKGGINLYRFINNRPTVSIDPFGLLRYVCRTCDAGEQSACEAACWALGMDAGTCTVLETYGPGPNGQEIRLNTDFHCQCVPPPPPISPPLPPIRSPGVFCGDLGRMPRPRPEPPPLTPDDDLIKRILR